MVVLTHRKIQVAEMQKSHKAWLAPFGTVNKLWGGRRGLTGQNAFICNSKSQGAFGRVQMFSPQKEIKNIQTCAEEEFLETETP